MIKRGKEIYQLRIEDFIPVVGLRNHMERCITNMKNLLDEHYVTECFARDMVLTVYNTTIITGAVCAGVSGLAELLFK